MFGKKFLNLNTLAVFFFFLQGLGNHSNVVSLVRHGREAHDLSSCLPD